MTAEIIEINTDASKEELYIELIPQIKSLIKDENNLIANLANISAALKSAFGFLWVGFYLLEGDELVLGPFQGPVACTRIKRGKGVCGTVLENKESIIVPDVDKFPGHIACSSFSRSEIVVPIFNKSKAVVAVLDIDSENLNTFDKYDREYLEHLSKIISHYHFS